MDPEIRWTEAPPRNYVLDEDLVEREERFPNYTLEDVGASYMSITNILLVFRLMSSIGLLTCAILQTSNIQIFLPDTIATTVAYFVMSLAFALLSISTNYYKKRKSARNFSTFTASLYAISACLSSIQIREYTLVFRDIPALRVRSLLLLVPLFLYIVDVLFLKSRIRFTYYQGCFIGSLYSVVMMGFWIINQKRAKGNLKIEEIFTEFVIELILYNYLSALAIFVSRIHEPKSAS